MPANVIEWLAVIGLGLFPVGLAFFAWDYGTKHGDIQVLGAISYAAPLISTIVLIAFGMGALTWSVFWGCVFIVGVLWSAQRAFSDDTAPKSIPLIKFKSPVCPLKRLIIPKVSPLQLSYLLWGFLPIYMKALSHVPAAEVVAHRVLWSVPVAMIVLVALRRTSDLKNALDQNALWVWRY